MRLEKISGDGPDALYNLYYENQLVAEAVTLRQLKEAIDRLEAQEVKRHE